MLCFGLVYTSALCSAAFLAHVVQALLAFRTEAGVKMLETLQLPT